MSTPWQELVNTDLGYVQWCALPLAASWIREAERRTSPGVVQALEGRPYAEQARACYGAWEAISNAYRALNLPCLSDPEYQRLALAWWGPVANVDATAAARGVVRGVDASGGTTLEKSRAAWVGLGKTPPDGRRELCASVVRLSLAYPESTVVRRCVGDRRDDPERTGGADCDFAGMWTGCAQEGARIEGCEPWTWASWAWWAPPVVVVGDETRCLVARSLPPLHWSIELAALVAASLEARGARGVLDAGRLFVVARNAQIAREAGILPRELEELAAALPRTVAELRDMNPSMRRTAGYLGAAAAALAVIPGAQIPAAILGALGGVVGILPAAVGFQADNFGRGLPLLEHAQIAVGTVAHPAPRYDVPEVPDAGAEVGGGATSGGGGRIPPLNPGTIARLFAEPAGPLRLWVPVVAPVGASDPMRRDPMAAGGAAVAAPLGVSGTTLVVGALALAGVAWVLRG